MILFIAAGIQQFIRFMEMRQTGALEESLRQSIRQGDRIADPTKAVPYFERLSPMRPEITLRIIQREWEIASTMHKRSETRRSSENSTTSAPDAENLARLLDQMETRCNGLIEKGDAIPENIRWQAYNLRGAVRLAAACTALESGDNQKKIITILKAALVDFKRAVSSVDRAVIDGWERNIPRWNLELLFSLTPIRKLEWSTADAHRIDLKKNLEALIPERAGYSAGEPPDRRVEK